MATAASGIWLSAPTRFARLSRDRARLAGVLVAALLLLCLLALGGDGPAAVDRAAAAQGGAVAEAAAMEDRADVYLYDGIVAELREGEGYYPAAARKLREGDYPLKPFFTFRLPTLALVRASLPDGLVTTLLIALGAGAAIAWFVRMRPIFRRLPPTLVVPLLVVASMAPWLQGDYAGFHEVWAGPLIALSLALWRPERPVTAIAIALSAMLIRETAALYAGVMALAALIEGRRREVAWWSAAVAIFLVVVATHAWAVAQVVRDSDLPSPGWLGLLGPGFPVKATVLVTALDRLPMALAAPLVGVSLVGWAGWRDPLARRVLGTLAAYGLLLAVFCRADTYYWAILVAPFALVGLALAPDALRDLYASLVDRRRITVTRPPR